MIEISIVIPTYNRKELLPRTVPALTQQQAEGFEYEVLFLDDGSDDDSRLLIEEAVRQNPERVRYLRLEHSGTPSGPRNRGIHEARGKIVLLLDDDVIPDADLVSRHRLFHQKYPAQEYAALGELYLPPDAAEDPMSLFHTFPYDEVRGQSKLSYLFFWTCNVSLKRSFMLGRGMFDEDPALYPVEDMECGYRLCEAGLQLVFLPEARGQHVHKMHPSWVPGKGERLGKAQFALTEKVHDIGVKARFGIIDPALPPMLYAWRVLRRKAFGLVDNPLTLTLLRVLGAERSRRNRITDAYYYLIFRRNIVAGYCKAKSRFATRSLPSSLQEQAR